MDRLPREIRESTRALVWRYEYVNDRLTKVPYQARRPDRHAKVSDPVTWGSFDQALAVVRAGKADGPGIVLGGGLVGVDLDHCRDPRTGAIAPVALEVVQALATYTEVSPSGSGLHLLARGVLPPGGRKKHSVEMYDEARYFTVTGEHLGGTPLVIHERTAELAALHARIFGTNGHGRRQAPPRTPAPLDLTDAALLELARAAPDGAKFTALYDDGDTSAYDSWSQADLALCNLLAFWTGADAARMDRLFRASRLMRPKWDARRGEQTYGERTIAKAIAGRRATYSAMRVAGGAKGIGTDNGRKTP